MVRAGKFKTKRGGGRNFSKTLGEDAGEDTFEKWQKKSASDDEDDSEEESEEESESGSGSGSDSSSGSSLSPNNQPLQPVGITATRDPKKAAAFGNTVEPEPLTRAEIKAQKAAQKKGKAQAKKQVVESDSEEDSEDDMPKDLRGIGRLNVDAKGKPVVAGSKDQGLNRKEREAEDKKAAAERYRQLHAAGKTDQAKADLARLQRIRKDREEAAAKRLAEAAAAKEAADAKKATQKLRG